MLYAAYGSNLHPVRLSLRLPGAIYKGTAAIPGRRLRFHKRSVDKSGKCNIATGDGTIHVAVYKLTEAEKSRLAEIEGTGYTIETLDVPGFGECFTYVAALSYIDERLLPYSWYRELVLVGCEALSLPAEYIARIQDIPAINDPDEGRQADNMKIVDLARASGQTMSV